MRIPPVIPALILLSAVEAHSLAQNAYSARIEQPDPLPVPEICMVMIDPETEKNMIIWEKSPDFLINQYQVLRISGAEFNLVTESMRSDSSVMIDPASKPGTKTDAYVLVSIDTCGNLTPKSDWHKPFFLQSSIGLNDVINLNWQPYLVNGEEYIFRSIVIFRGTDSTKLSAIDTISAGIGSTTYTDENPPLNVNVYYRIAGEKEIPCNPYNIEVKKASKGPFIHSLSNLEDNRLHSTAVSRINSESLLKIYPNPMITSSRIEWNSQNDQDCMVTIYDLRAKIVRSIPVKANTGFIILEKGDLESGCYIVEIKGSNTSYGRLLVN